MSSLAKITKKYIIKTKMQTLAPISIASGIDDGITDIVVLKNKQGKAFVPGSSIAGVLRNTMKNIYGDEAVGRFFGYADGVAGEQSMLNISDIVLENGKQIYRDGVAIDSFRGVGKKGAKFDFEAIDRGAYGELVIEVTVRNNEPPQLTNYLHNSYAVSGDAYGEMAATLADILTAGISVGARTTKGFGLMQGQDVELHCFDFAADGAANWLEYLNSSRLPKAVYKGSADEIATAATNVFNMEACFAVSSSLLVRDYDEAQRINDKNINDDSKLVSVQMKSGSDILIPGSSIKGVLRSRAKKIIMSLNGGSEQEADAFIADFMGSAEIGAVRKSRLSVKESYISSKELKSHIQTRNRIDRFTGGTMEGSLFSEEPVWQHDKSLAPLKLSLSVSSCSAEEAGLMLLLLKDLWLGALPIGGDKAIGRGALSGRSCRIFYGGQKFAINGGNGFKVEGDKAGLEQYVQQFVECAKEMAVKK